MHPIEAALCGRPLAAHPVGANAPLCPFHRADIFGRERRPRRSASLQCLHTVLRLDALG